MKPFFLRRLKADVSSLWLIALPTHYFFHACFNSHFKGPDWPASKDCHSRKGPNVHTTGITERIAFKIKSADKKSFFRRSFTTRWLQTTRTEQQRWILLAAIFVEKFFSISYIQRYLLYFFFQISEQLPPVNVALPLANNLNPLLIACQWDQGQNS